ncbi:uncharacterized protein LACBIDRAFT_331477 [Laccaria bicolor S238N-H82]|uniref:Predicted protein n=1 Tax=Laccaria bicolor (strain S238N-H82 / ATCC MYA-4686) TaxID=486041 RepID=B0DPL1_LACBS|nr:uncharacterized protein LACBIDRAFT_331477 [Laccaria bicolor S238N-H82]EDR03471.1 predicted protein [Laccaria bicolor S238N-H82]|eukprot:XP_001885927.1 predicted protein [Laccaria bicolor S238N-H82]
MSLITVSAVVNTDASFAFQPYGLPENKSISVHQVATATGMYQIIYDSIFESTPVVTVTPAWLGNFGCTGGLTVDNAVINEIKKTYVIVKLGDSHGNGQWRPFTIVLTGHCQRLPKKPEHKEEAHKLQCRDGQTNSPPNDWLRV